MTSAPIGNDWGAGGTAGLFPTLFSQ